jgi:beta-phosphoglucomutase family hydrolase
VIACLFDLDGVLTDTASVHAAAWKEAFDGFLAARAGETAAATETGTLESLSPFSIATDYPRYVDGKPRLNGVADFLASRHISLPVGTPEDSSDADTIWGLGNRKNVIVLRRMHEDGITVYPGSRAYLAAATAAGVRRAVVSSSANTASVLHLTELEQYIELRVDGATIQREHLAGKPAPDTFLAAAQRLGVHPSQAAVFEDALAGVSAGKAGGFGIVIGVNRLDDAHGRDLLTHGADIVVTDLADLMTSSARR